MPDAQDALCGAIFVGANGYVTCIDKESGAEVWRRSLPGSGYKFVNVLLEDERVFAASGGKLYCLWADSGEIIWSNNMKGLGYGIFAFATAESSGDGVATEAASKAASSHANRTSSR